MNVDIIIPSCKIQSECSELIRSIYETRTTEGSIIFTGLRDSAAKNRNKGLNLAMAPIVIMVDDDICGLFKGWDSILVEDLESRKEDVCLMSAIFLGKDGKPQLINGHNPDRDTPIVLSQKGRIATPCICFRKDQTRFDENFIGSGWEDDDFSLVYRKNNGNKAIAFSNRCQLIHNNEMKNQKGKFWEHNMRHFRNKWGSI